MSELATQQMSENDARRLTERIRIAAVNFSESRGKLMSLVEEAKAGNAHLALKYKTWQAYLADTLGDEPMVIARNDGRPEMVRALTDQGMSTRATAAVMGVGVATVHRDLSATVPSGTVEPRISHGMDGKTRVHQPRPEPQFEPAKPKRRPLPDQAGEAGWDLARAIERVERIISDDRFTANKETVAPHLRSHLTNAVEACQDLLDRINH